MIILSARTAEDDIPLVPTMVFHNRSLEMNVLTLRTLQKELLFWWLNPELSLAFFSSYSALTGQPREKQF
jgi:hypothetical protein